MKILPLHLDAPPLALPEGRRPPCGWPAVALVPGSAGVAVAPIDTSAATLLRLTGALDDRCERRVMLTANDGTALAACDLRYLSALQTAQVAVPAGALAHGGWLRQVGDGTPWWILSGSDSDAPRLAPHLLLATDSSPAQEMRLRLASADTLQAFGWKEGCVLDALLDLGLADAARARLRRVVADDGTVDYEDHLSRRVRNQLYGIEGGLPYAALARIDPAHPALAVVRAFWRERMDATGVVADPGELTAEGCYTVGYAMACVGRSDPALRSAARRQVAVRLDRLWHDGSPWLRCHADGHRTFRAWARGVGWQLLGAVRTARTLEDPSLLALAAPLAAWAAQHQRADGLWSAYLDEPTTVGDTSGSAAIATALALGWPSYRCQAQRAADAIASHLTPDGLLHGACQENKGGEALQRSGYRVLSGYALGLYGQLQAALHG